VQESQLLEQFDSPESGASKNPFGVIQSGMTESEWAAAIPNFAPIELAFNVSSVVKRDYAVVYYGSSDFFHGFLPSVTVSYFGEPHGWMLTVGFDEVLTANLSHGSVDPCAARA
jgi:hypothetical protein